MPVHEQIHCARCNGVFECKVGDIAHCHCNEIVLTAEERSYIESKYNACLCHQCLKDLKNKYTLFTEKYLSH